MRLTAPEDIVSVAINRGHHLSLLYWSGVKKQTAAAAKLSSWQADTHKRFSAHATAAAA